MNIPTTIPYDGKQIYFRSVVEGFIKARRRLGFSDVCPLCKKTHFQKDKQKVVLITSNQVGIPNRIVHYECMKDDLPEYVFQLIAQDWENAQKYKDWFTQNNQFEP